MWNDLLDSIKNFIQDQNSAWIVRKTLPLGEKSIVFTYDVLNQQYLLQYRRPRYGTIDTFENVNPCSYEGSRRRQNYEKPHPRIQVCSALNLAEAWI